jgi:Mg2+-importing ATPase
MHHATTIAGNRTPIADKSARETTAHVGWLSWTLGGAVLVAVVAAALHFSEERAFVHVAQEAKPWWLLMAVVLQVGTYIAQAGVWRLAAHATGHPLARRTAVELSLAKLFADQALPSAGLSSSILIAKALERRQFSPASVKAAVLINIASYHLAYVIALAGAVAILARRGEHNSLVTITSLLFLLFSIGLSLVILVTAGRHVAWTNHLARRFRVAQPTLAFLTGADGELVRSPRVLGAAVSLQGTIVLLDAATVWMLLGALGVWAPATAVFASFMVASLFRTMGILPGGLGTFEATSVLMLRLIGVDVAVGLSATLLFRGLSFWLPMVPGYWCSRRSIATVLPPRQSTAFLAAYRSIDPPAKHDANHGATGIRGARVWSQSGAAACHPQRKPGAKRADDGESRRARQAAERD